MPEGQKVLRNLSGLPDMADQGAIWGQPITVFFKVFWCERDRV